MSSILRPLYDRLYIGVDTMLLSLDENLSCRKLGRDFPWDDGFEMEFRKVVRPYWRRYGVEPKRYFVAMDNEYREHLDPRYVPDDVWVRNVVPHFNHLLFAQALQDKCLHNLFLPDVKRPVTVVKNVSGVFYDDELNLLTEEMATERCLRAGRCIVKRSVGSGRGKDITFFNGSDMDPEKVRELFAGYKNRNFIVQEKLTQHKDLNAIYPDALNTVRVVSFLYKGKVHILSAILRMGAGGSEVDNYSQGGYSCGIRADGTLNKYAIQAIHGRHERHPNGAVLEGMAVPSYDRIIDTVRTAASRMAHFPILGWDFGVDESGEPVFIEYNVIPGQNQRECGPAFGDMTEEVLREVFGR